MMFSERLEYGKYDFQPLQGTLRCVYGHQKPDVLRVYNENQSGWISLFQSFPFLKKHIFCARKNFGEKKSGKNIFRQKSKVYVLSYNITKGELPTRSLSHFFTRTKSGRKRKCYIVDIGYHMFWASELTFVPADSQLSVICMTDSVKAVTLNDDVVFLFILLQLQRRRSCAQLLLTDWSSSTADLH